MSKGLDAITNLIPRFYDDLPNVSPEEYVRLGKVREELLKIIEKELKALEIIKEKIFNGKEDIIVLGNVELTQEEYSLLKEVLND